MRGKKKIWAVAVLTSLFFGLEVRLLAQEYPPGQWDTIIENQDFTTSLKLDTGDDNTLIINSKFHDIVGRGIQIRNVSNVYIKDCEIYNIRNGTVQGNGIHLRSTGSTDRVTIDGCLIHDIEADGIHGNSGSGTTTHTNLVIKNNRIYDTGTKIRDGHYHNIYTQTSGAIIENNVFYNSWGGSHVSIRGSAVIRGNVMLGNAQKSGIRYYSDQPAGPSDLLIIENNFIYEGTSSTLPGNHPLVSLLYASAGTLVSQYVIRFNTIVSADPARYGFSVQSSQFDSKNVEVYGNIIINTENSGRVFDSRYVDYNSRNYTSTTADGFVNANTVPYDFHLTPDSPALGWATGEASFPAFDLDGQPRPSADGQLDAGADQTNSGPPPPDQPKNFKFKQP